VDLVAGAESAGGAHDALRAGNTEREQVVQRLNRAFGEGRLELTELEERVAQAYAAKTLGELRPLTADLPPDRGVPLPTDVPPPPSRPATVQDLKQVALDLATSRLNARLERDRERQMRRQHRLQQQHQRRELTRQLTDNHPVAAWATASLVCFVIWLIVAVTGGAMYPWFLWVAGPWGVALLVRYVAGRGSS